jgi:hypothetical protein
VTSGTDAATRNNVMSSLGMRYFISIPFQKKNLLRSFSGGRKRNIT